MTKLYVNQYLSTKTSKVYNAHYGGHNILLTPIVQQPSKQVTYAWRLTHQHHSADSDCFNSAQLALANAKTTLTQGTHS